jgi:iron complex outermembrane receptor protein
MKRLKYLKSALVGGASALAIVHPAAAKVFDVPGGDLASALDAYMRQAGVEIVYSNDIVHGHRSPGARGDYTETAALTQLLRGTGFTAQAMPLSDAIGIVPQQPKPVERLAQAAPRHAPTAPMPSQPAAIETVVVTAQHKSENIQQVPIAITALSQAQLTERQIAGGPDLVKEVPNLTFSKTNFSGYNLEIRGIGTQAISVTTDPAVAVAFNGIPFIRNHFFEQEFFDLQDVEVLRGPQGTLYGRNATAGVVNLKSALPTDQYEAMLSADMGNYSNRRLEGMLNIPVAGDTLDIRMAAEWTKRDGYSFNDITDRQIDGRDLWSSRLTVGWKPTSDIQSYLVWEHFSEDDDRLRSGKQLCKTAPIPTTVEGQPTYAPVAGSGAGFDGTIDNAAFLSQGCEMTSLYSPDAFEVPNPYTLAYYTGLDRLGIPLRGASGTGTEGSNFNVYGTVVQSPNLRVISSQINPTYKAKNDTLELNTDYRITPSLTFTSQTGYNRDFLWSSEDYNRFDSVPGVFVYEPDNTSFSSHPGITLPDPNGPVIDGVPSGIFCDPQLGCSDRLLAEDLSDEHAWQLSQEFRLSSNFAGPLNFSFGGNFLHYETEENYYVFINTLTMAFASGGAAGSKEVSTPYVPGVFDNSYCLIGGYKLIDPAAPHNIGCSYIDPNPITGLNNEGHTYFLSQNPYVLNSYAGFGEVYYSFTDDLKLTGGLRWTDDQKHFIDIPSELVEPGWGYAVTGIVNQQWDVWTGRTALDWTPKLDFTDQTLVYGSYAHGYKAGGANPPGALFPAADSLGITSNETTNPIHPLTFKPEFIEAFELGTKNTLLDGSLILNGDIFYYNYMGYQISEIVDRTAINNNYNAHVEGAELETNWEPLPGLKFSLSQGFENAALAGGNQGIDLMDRTAGNPGWMVVKPFVTNASNCILPLYVVAAILQQAGTSGGGIMEASCPDAYNAHEDPLTCLPYVANPTTSACAYWGPPPGYPGFNPVSPTATNPDLYNGTNAGSAPNNGEGFDKNLSGKQLPNAPHFTTSLTAEYTLPVSDDWAATLHTDFYWQSQQWARVFNDPIDKIHGYSNVNLALILSSDNGWQVMGYVKNVFDTTAITGTFLNSDDSGLTTNVFLTDPRLYGIRVTKQLDQNDGFWGSDYSGADFFTGLFSDTDNGKPPLWIEIGGQLDRLNVGEEPYAPPFMVSVTRPGLLSALDVQHQPLFAIDAEGKISFQPEDSDWIITAGIRYGRSASNLHLHHQTPNAKIPIHFDLGSQYIHNTVYPNNYVKLADGMAHDSETHGILDFQAGKDVGLGWFGSQGTSVVSAGVRIAQLVSNSDAALRAKPDVQYPTKPVTSLAGDEALKYDIRRFHSYTGIASSRHSFHGFGPSLAWNASVPVAGSPDGGELNVDWGANAAVLFGRQNVQGRHQTTMRFYSHKWFDVFPTSNPPRHITGKAIDRTRTVAVPNLGGFAGVSWQYQNAKVSFGYRADEFFGAMDGGIDTYKAENRGFFGPFANISIGLGG